MRLSGCLHVPKHAAPYLSTAASTRPSTHEALRYVAASTRQAQPFVPSGAPSLHSAVMGVESVAGLVGALQQNGAAEEAARRLEALPSALHPNRAPVSVAPRL